MLVPGVWNGFACLSNPCVHGVCVDDLNSTYFCYCIDGYTGIQCQTNWNECWSSPCRNGGTCIDGIAMFNCSCPPGYAGDICEEDINECESNPCLNNGTCLDAHNGYTCNCLLGYSGVHCEIDIAVCNATNETRCSNGGICEEGPGETFTCYCQPGWAGFLCESEVNECFTAPCQNGGVCIDFHADYSCACLFGMAIIRKRYLKLLESRSGDSFGSGILMPYRSPKVSAMKTGPPCISIDLLAKTAKKPFESVTKNPCKNAALCLLEDDQSVCYCVPDFHGELCQFQYDECQLGPRCMNGGTCIDGIDNFTCSCPQNLTGVLCECLILEDNHLDCTYVSPTISITTVTSDNVSLVSTLPTFVSIITSTISSKTTEVPTTTEITKWTDNAHALNETLDTTEFPVTPVITNYTSLTDTTLVEETTTFVTTTQREKETNRTFPEEPMITFVPSFSTFFTTEPTKKMEASTLMTTSFTTFEATTLEPTEGTTMAGLDCTKAESYCQNGGTCVYTQQEYKCVCPFDTEGIFCETKLGIIISAFSGGSYLAHRLLNLSHIVLEFEAKTMANNGILFYSNVDTTYMALYMQEGFLKFRFSCGYQTMLLSEVKVPVNNGYNMNIKAELEFSNGFKHCDATIKVNNSLSMTGDQIAKVDHLVKQSSGWLYLGGTPQEVFSEVWTIGGFIGCMSNLKNKQDQQNNFENVFYVEALKMYFIANLLKSKRNQTQKFFLVAKKTIQISNKEVNIYKDADDGVDITECSSLACLSNPCRHGASCTSLGDNWQCHCKDGYLGKTCDISICDNNPCLYGGTCIPFTNNGYICLCPYGKHGHFCEDGILNVKSTVTYFMHSVADLKITEPYFSSTVRGLSSYVAYPIPDGVSKKVELKFRFTPTTMEQISLLLFVGQSGHHDFYSDHLAVSFVKGYIMLTWNLGSGPRRIFTSQPIKKGARDYLVRLGHFGRRAWLYVENVGNVTGRSPGNLVQLDIVPLLFIGGHHSRNFSLLSHDLPLHTGFSGCIFDIEMKSGSVVIPIQGNRQTFGRAVGQWRCLCQDNWYGPLCSSKNNLCHPSFSKCDEKSTCVPLLSNYECDCSLGKLETTAKMVRISVSENITEIGLTGKRSYIVLHPVEIESSTLHIEMEIRILGDQGVIIFIGKSTSEFICLSLLNSLLELRIYTGKNRLSTVPLTIRSSKLLVKGIWNKVKFGLFGRKAYLSVDNILNTGTLQVGQIVSISSDNIFIGGFPDMSEFPNMAAAALPMYYIGCIRHLFIDDKHIPLTSENIKTARNTINCNGTPCGGETCLNGGTCWLDSFLKPHCSCVPSYYGDKCEIVTDCDEKMCKNQGKCYNKRCSCNIGWGGAFCEKEISVKTPEFVGNSYLVVTKSGDKKRELRDVEIMRIVLNFTTAKPDGLLLWSKKDANFIGIGIERGLLKLSYSSTKTGKTVTEVPFHYPISDGLWHNIELNFASSSIKVDGNLLDLQNKEEMLSENALSTDGVYYIGGLPTNISLLEETNGTFHNKFEGCIESFGTNSELVKDFRHYEGTNIETCELV
ncbi:hypothetical protein NQ317_019280 [Molorchus minor]|uniref:Protein eyes shut n=1 Tax=Molorchus minor TaxID=1323400 RepID=A0ABQ9J8W5_9CUCU|nr:hypothetical protein NQ317_019280 [Molorchus minor]